MNNDNKTVLAIVAHPDDAEFLCAGTLALLKEKGWRIEVATKVTGLEMLIETAQKEWGIDIVKKPGTKQ